MIARRSTHLENCSLRLPSGCFHSRTTARNSSALARKLRKMSLCSCVDGASSPLISALVRVWKKGLDIAVMVIGLLSNA